MTVQLNSASAGRFLSLLGLDAWLLGIGGGGAAAGIDIREPVEVVGLGASGLATVRFLNERGIAPGVMDTRRELPAGDAALQGLEYTASTLGELSLERLLVAGTVVISPGLPRETPEIASAIMAGVEVIGDIELFARAVAAPVVAITGSNGKSTVTTLLREMAAAQGLDVRAGGNLGPPALALVSNQDPDLYVLELSSFQLESISSLRPAAAVVLNLSEDHLDRYAGMADYAHAKFRIFRHAGSCLLGEQCLPFLEHARAGCGWLHEGAAAAPVLLRSGPPAAGEYGVAERDGDRWFMHGERPLAPISGMKLSGRHNETNALAAWALGEAVGLSESAMRRALASFAGLPHRCELVAEVDGIRWINDSKGTNVGASVAAIEGLADAGGIVLIAGGEGKDADFEPLAEAIGKHVRQVILIGRDARLIEASLADDVPRVHAESLSDAVHQARMRARDGDAVLLSPACASFDMFRNYNARGDAFRESVKQMLRGRA